MYAPGTFGTKLARRSLASKKGLQAVGNTIAG